MLNLAAYQLLADKERLDDGAVRLFMRMMADYDLTKYRAISVPLLHRLYGTPRMELAVQLKSLTKWHLLEMGPRVAVPLENGKSATYRIGSHYLLSKGALEEWFQEMKAREERRKVMPPETEKRRKRSGFE